MAKSALVLGILLGAMVPAAAATPENFQVRSAADLVTICSTTASDNNSSAMVGFCHGYVVGVYQLLQEVAQARPAGRFFCTPAVTPNRTQAIKSYVDWANARPNELSKLPMESIADYLAVTYPCPDADKAGPAGTLGSPK